ncbi:hypothetical protein AC622_19600 [Bacillus sp. FJAT-27916]|nr:hypothetical protein AC622_19600 [Bacillus sp. FJAT-27916]
MEKLGFLSYREPKQSGTAHLIASLSFNGRGAFLFLWMGKALRGLVGFTKSHMKRGLCKCGSE